MLILMAKLRYTSVWTFNHQNPLIHGQSNKHTHMCAQCSHTSVGLAQARPNNPVHTKLYNCMPSQGYNNYDPGQVKCDFHVCANLYSLTCNCNSSCNINYPTLLYCMQINEPGLSSCKCACGSGDESRFICPFTQALANAVTKCMSILANHTFQGHHNFSHPLCQLTHLYKS